MRDEDDADAAVLQVAHQAEEHLDLLVVQRRRGLVEDQHLAVRVHRARDGDHLLHGERAAAELLPGARGDAEALQQLAGALLHCLPVHAQLPAAADEHVLRHREVRAERDLLIHGADAAALRLLRGVDADGALDPVDPDLSFVHGINAGQHLDERGLARAIFAHQRVDRPFAQGEVHVFQCLDARKILADPAHRQDNVLLHPINSCLFVFREGAVWTADYST